MMSVDALRVLDMICLRLQVFETCHLDANRGRARLYRLAYRVSGTGVSEDTPYSLPITGDLRTKKYRANGGRPPLIIRTPIPTAFFFAVFLVYHFSFLIPYIHSLATILAALFNRS